MRGVNPFLRQHQRGVTYSPFREITNKLPENKGVNFTFCIQRPSIMLTKVMICYQNDLFYSSLSKLREFTRVPPCCSENLAVLACSKSESLLDAMTAKALVTTNADVFLHRHCLAAATYLPYFHYGIQALTGCYLQGAGWESHQNPNPNCGQGQNIH